MNRKFILGLLLLIFSYLVTACIDNAEADRNAYQTEFPVAKVFEDFYNDLGGRATLGPAISPLHQVGEVSYQYSLTTLMVYDNASKQYSLAALGRDMAIQEKPFYIPDSSKGVLSNGYYIYPSFIKMYEKIGGSKIVGLPLTNVRFNEQYHRYEQYFENLGFYQMADDPDGQVYLLAYGYWRCAKHCSYSTPLNARIDIPIKKAAPFVKFLGLVGSDYTGFALTEPYLASDGKLEQVFEHLVMIADPADPEHVYLRPLPEIVGIKHDPLERVFSEPGFYFFPIEGDLGYNIPERFMDVIKARGGLKISGPPISRAQKNHQNMTVQCFKYLCLEEGQDPYNKTRITPQSLGYVYREQIFNDNHKDQGIGEYQEISIHLNKRYPMISSEGEQEIIVWVFLGDKPLSNVEPILVVNAPDQTSISLSMPPTGENGESRIQLPVIIAKNGTLIPFEVCLSLPDTQKFCGRDSYLIWDTGDTQKHSRQFLPVIIQEANLQVELVFLPVIIR